MRYLLVFSLLFLSTPLFALDKYDYKTDKTLKWINGKVDADITYTEMFKYFKKIETIQEMVCKDIMPFVWQRFDNTHYDEVCD